MNQGPAWETNRKNANPTGTWANQKGPSRRRKPAGRSPAEYGNREKITGSE